MRVQYTRTVRFVKATLRFVSVVPMRAEAYRQRSGKAREDKKELRSCLTTDFTIGANDAKREAAFTNRDRSRLLDGTIHEAP